MKFGRAKLPKTFYKIPKKSFKRKKKNNKESNSIEDRKVNSLQIFVTIEQKVLSLGKFGVVGTRDQRGLALHFGLQKIFFLEHHATARKPKMMQKGIVTFHPTNLTKVTYISSILKFLNTKRLEVKVSNTRFNIQSLHL